MKGSYILVIEIHKNSEIQIGALGYILFNKGFYFYVGSAMGVANSSTLINRVKRHISLTSNKKFHWHIDYLLANINSSINHLYLIPSTVRWECTIAQELMDLTNGYIKNFGSSDCNCISHLYYSKNSNNIGKE
jgi:Uri superfamily endonuclease